MLSKTKERFLTLAYIPEVLSTTSKIYTPLEIFKLTQKWQGKFRKSHHQEAHKQSCFTLSVAKLRAPASVFRANHRHVIHNCSALAPGENFSTAKLQILPAFKRLFCLLGS